MLLFFGGSIFIHELGHFLAAKMRGLKVLRFSIGFGPRLFSWRGKDGCEYIVAMLPFGGYVALPQLADMGALEGGNDEDPDAKNLPPAGFADKVIVSSAGAFFNILFAAVLAAVVWVIGIPESASLKTNVIGYVPEQIADIDGTAYTSPAKEAGLKAGDKILSIDGRDVNGFADIVELIAIGSGRDAENNPKASITIERGGKIENIEVSPRLIRTNLTTGDEIRMIGIAPMAQMKVGSVMENSPAQKAGVKPGDFVTAVDGIALYSNSQLGDYLNTLPTGQSVKLEVLRDGKQAVLEVTPQKVVRTRPLCEVGIGKNGGAMNLILSQNEKTDPADLSAKGLVKVFSAKSDNPQFKGVKPGFILYQADGKDISSLSQINALVNVNEGKAMTKLSFMSPDYSTNFDAFLPADSTSKILPPYEQTMLGYVLENVTVVSHPSIWAQFKDSLVRTYNALSSLVNPKSDIGINSLAGPVDIGRVIYKLSFADISLVISFAVLLNINLAILNMMPIPVLDGGHIMFAAIAKLRGKPLPPTFFAGIQGIFTLLFLSLMVYIVYYGFMRWDGDSALEQNSSLSSDYYINNVFFSDHE